MFTGCGTALVTPFRRDQSLDEETLRQPGPPPDRRRHQLPGALRHHGRKPHAHARRAPARGRDHARRSQGQGSGAGRRGRLQHPRSHRAGARTRTLGVDGILSVTPYYNKPTQEGLYQHYKAIAAAIRLPIIVYSVQGRTGVNVEPATLARLAADRQHRRREGSLRQHRARWPTCCTKCRRDFTVLSGDDAITIPLMALGGRGVISVVSNEIPGEMTQLAQACLRGDFAAARAIQRRYLPLMNVNFVESNPIPVKAAMGADGPARAGLPPAAWCRPAAASLAQIEKVLEAVGLLGSVPVAG